MNKTEETLCALIKSALFGTEVAFPEDVCWEDVFSEAGSQAVVALVSGSVPKEFSADWTRPTAQIKAHFMRALYEQSNLVALYDKAGIPFVIIKGTAAAIYYPNPSDRTMGDVDVLVPEEYFDAAFALLKDNGYEFYRDYGDGRDHAFKKGGVFFELHRRYSDEGHDIEPVLRRGMENAVRLSLYGNVFPALPKSENALLLLDHIRHHLHGGLGIRQIIDFMLFVYSEPEDAIIKEHLPLFEKAGVATLARVIVKMCEKYFGLPVSASWADAADEKTCDELMERLFASGNFGRKKPYEYRPVQSFFITAKKQGFFRTLQRAGLINSATIRDHKLLRPFAWLYQLGRYSIKALAAIFKKEKLLTDVSEAKEKADFYERLGIL